MTAVLLPNGKQQYFTTAGAPAVGYKLATFAAGTSTPQVTWQDALKVAQNTNPIILDGRGEASVFWDGVYKVQLQDSTGAVIWTQDNLQSQQNSLSTSLVPAVTNTVDLGSVALSWRNLYLGANNAPALDAVSGNIGYFARTVAETTAGVTPTNYSYAPGDVRRYGVTGVGDETAKLQQALNVQQDVFIPSGLTVNTTASVTMLSNQTLYGAGWDSQILCNGTNINAVVLTGKTRAIVRDLFVKYTAVAFSTGLDSAAVFIGSGASYCAVKGCRLEGTRAGVTVNYADRITITDNIITSANSADVCWDIGVYLGGTHNIISRNRCEGGVGTASIGTNGIYILSDNTHGCDWNIVSDNDVGTHNQYGILLYANLPGGSAQHNTVIGNIVHDITGTYNSGSGVVFGAGLYVASAEWTTVVGNFFYNTNVNTATLTLAPGAIGIGGVSCFTVMGNVIRAPVWYGIYVATDGNLSGSGLIEGNVITSPSKDGIGLSAMNNVSVIGNAVTGGAQAGISYTNASAGTGISIQGNKIKNCTGTALNLTGLLQCPNISGNYEANCLNGLILQNTNGGIICGNEFRNNTSNDVFLDNTNSGFIHFDRNVVRSTAPNGVNDATGMVYGVNDVAGQTTVFGQITMDRVLTTSATPSVLGSRLANYGGATAVTDLLNPMPGQIITIRSTGTPTFQHNTGAAATKLILQGAVNFVMANQNTLTLEYLPGGPWYEVSRKT